MASSQHHYPHHAHLPSPHHHPHHQIHHPQAISPRKRKSMDHLQPHHLPSTTNGFYDHHLTQQQHLMQPGHHLQQQQQHPGLASPVGGHHPGASPSSASPKRLKNRLEGLEDSSNLAALKAAKVTPDGRYICDECGKSLVSIWGLDAHIKTVHGKKTFKCEFCVKAFARRDHLVNHTNSIHLNEKVCSKCGERCKGKEGLAEHVAKAHPSSQSPSATTSPSGAFPCTACGQTFPSDSACQIHVKQFHEKVKCAQCRSSCVGTEELKTHIRNVHMGAVAPTGRAAATTNSTPAAAAAPSPAKATSRSSPSGPSLAPSGHPFFKCTHCAGTFVQQSSLQQHIEAFHVEMQCGVCGSSLVGSQAMLEHVKEAHQPNSVVFNQVDLSFHCDLCNLSFEKKSHYDHHFLRQHVFRGAGNSNGNGAPPGTPGTKNNNNHQSHIKSAAAGTPIQNGRRVGSAASGSSLVVFQCQFCRSQHPSQELLSQHISRNHHGSAKAAGSAGGAAAGGSSNSSAVASEEQEDFQYEIYEKFFLKSPDRLESGGGSTGSGDSASSIISGEGAASLSGVSSETGSTGKEINLNSLNTVEEHYHNQISVGQKEQLFDVHEFNYDANSQFELLNADSASEQSSSSTSVSGAV